MGSTSLTGSAGMRLQKMVIDFGMIFLRRDYTLLFSDVSRCEDLGVIDESPIRSSVFFLPTGRVRRGLGLHIVQRRAKLLAFTLR
jgi:hypothetical protein